ncbi:permease [Candidatus Uhrbacteria bacterium]|nr:permease [Candidatus Uhrbacteria bacterium]
MDVFYPIRLFADWVTVGLLGITDPYWGSVVNFFIYDTVKIGLLLVLINYVMAVVRYYLPTERARDIIGGRKWYGFEYILAALLGVITPFCSCSSIPLFVGFVGAGIPLGVTFTFLVASPLINEASLFIFPAVFGFKMTAVYIALGVAVSVAVGLIIQRLKPEGNVNPAFLKFQTAKADIKKNGGKPVPFGKRAVTWWRDGMTVTKEVFPYALLGVGLGALIHGFVPRQFVESVLNGGRWWAVPTAVILGTPLYANSVSVVPVMEALVGKGVDLGTALAFMTATVTLSVPGLLILKKAISWKLLLAFVVSTAVGIVGMGYFFNYLWPIFA